MWLRWSREHHLRLLLSRIDCAREPTRELVEEVLERACPRLQVSPAPNDLLTRLIDSEAWVALALWLIEWELPDWGVHRLSRGDYCWNCAIRVRGLGRDWIGDVADFQHDVLALAIFGALVDAQLQKLGGCLHSGHVGTGQEGDGAQHDLCERPPRLGIRTRWALDTHSAYQVRLFLGEAAFLVLFGFPALLLNPHLPVLFFVLLKKLFGFMALTLLIVGLLTRQGMARASLGLWDHCIAFALLHVSCAVAVRILG